MCLLFVYLFYVFVYKFIYVYNKQGEDIRIGALGYNNRLYRKHLYCSEAVSRVMQGLFHDHVKRQLLWKFWDVFFKDVKGNYDASMMEIRYGLQLSSWILRLYTLHVTHIDSQTCKLAVIIYFDITHYSLTVIQTSYTLITSHPISYTSTYSDLFLYRHRTHSHYITSNIIHINLLRFVIIQTSYTLSLNHIQYHTHQPTQIYYTHNIL